MPRGGKRKGRVGAAYANRSDLRGPGTPDIPKSFQGQQYGTAKQQQQVQQAGAGGPSGAPMGGPGAPGPSGPAPGSLGAFGRPSERPGEPITSGLSTGPGPGPEVLGQMGGDPNDVAKRDMALYLPMLEKLASQPGASLATKVFVRRLRGTAPPQATGL